MEDQKLKHAPKVTRRRALVVLLLLLIMVVEVGLSTRQQSASWDEGNHIYAGYMNWKQGQYALNPEHPPLVKLVATLPLVPLDLKAPPRQGRYFKSEAYFGGRELLFRNDPKYGGKYGADTLLFRVHMAALVFGLILAGLLFAAGKEMFGATAGLIAMALFVFDPSVLANAPFVATDTGAACGFFAATYMFYRFAKSMSWQRAALCGMVVGLALTTKHSTIALAPLFALLASAEIACRWKAGRKFPGRDAARMLLGMGIIAAVAIVVLWGVYGFRWEMHPAGVSMPTLTRQTAPLAAPMKNFILFSAHYHLLPQSYLYGLADVQRAGLNWPAFIFGKIYARGQWFYFPVLLSAKWTLGTLGLLALAIYVLVSGKLRRWREIIFVAAPALFYLAVAMAGPLNMGPRHILPVFPFVFVLIGAGAAWLAKQRRRWALVVIVLLLAHGIDSARAFPNYLPYANALWGGPENIGRHFSDAAADWGQQLKWTKQWVDENKVTDCWFAYFVTPFLLPSDYGIPCKMLPTFDNSEANIDLPPVVRGPILISFGDLNGYEYGTKVRNPYQRLFERKPDHVIAGSIAVFYGDFALPEAAALAYQSRTYAQLRRNPQAALGAARTAVALAPDGFDANRALGDALAATGDPVGARAAYSVAMRRVEEMEPGAQARWRMVLTRRLADLSSKKQSR